MVAGQVAPRLHEEPAQARQERARREDDVRGAIGARRLERVDELAVARQREPAERERPSGSVTSQRPRRIPWKSRSAALAYGGLQDVRSRGTATGGQVSRETEAQRRARERYPTVKASRRTVAACQGFAAFKFHGA